MKKIPSFEVNHLTLIPGVYVSRIDHVGTETLTTYDLRMTRPNYEPVMNTAEVHCMEHLGATFLRNHKEYASRVIYFGPMGCRTGFYLILAGEETPAQIAPLLREMYTFMSTFEGNVPGQARRDCGNYLDMNLPMARFWSKRYLDEVLTGIEDHPERMVYAK
jgi:LuxS protein involved in autoinducer AI2 synthesis